MQSLLLLYDGLDLLSFELFVEIFKALHLFVWGQLGNCFITILLGAQLTDHLIYLLVFEEPVDRIIKAM